MTTRKTSISTDVDIETTECTQCGDEVILESDLDSDVERPKAVHVLIGSGKGITAKKKSLTGVIKDNISPEVIIRWFSDKECLIDTQVLCPVCAKSLYEFELPT